MAAGVRRSHTRFSSQIRLSIFTFFAEVGKTAPLKRVPLTGLSGNLPARFGLTIGTRYTGPPHYGRLSTPKSTYAWTMTM